MFRPWNDCCVVFASCVMMMAITDKKYFWESLGRKVCYRKFSTRKSLAQSVCKKKRLAVWNELVQLENRKDGSAKNRSMYFPLRWSWEMEISNAFLAPTQILGLLSNFYRLHPSSYNFRIFPMYFKSEMMIYSLINCSVTLSVYTSFLTIAEPRACRA